MYAAPEGSVGGAAGDGSMRSWVPPHRVHGEAVTPLHLHLHHVIVAQPAAGKGGGCHEVGMRPAAADQWGTHAVSETISPRTPVKPNAPAATAAAAMVLTLLGARGHSSATEPLNKTRRPSPSFQSERASPVSRKQDGCLDILMNTPWKHRRGGSVREKLKIANRH